MTTSEGIFFIGLVTLALSLTVISFKVRMLPLSVGASISWLVLVSAFVTGSVGPGFDEIWVDSIVLLFVLLAFTPLLSQMKQEVKNEVRLSGRSASWVTYEANDFDPLKKSKYDKHRESIRDIGTRVSKRRSARGSTYSNRGR